MPQIMPSGRGRRRFQVGSGFYTTGDAQRGTTPTPSQAARGLSSEDPESRWFALDAATKGAWQDAAQLGQSGRELYSQVNRVRLYFPGTTTDTPPPGPFAPTLYPFANLIVYAGDATGDDAVWTLDVTIPDNPDFDHENFEFSYYRPREPATGPLIRAAQWYSCSQGYAFTGPFPNVESLWNNALHGGGSNSRARVTLPAGSPILVRLLPCTDEGYPGPAIFLSQTVQPYRS